MDITNKDSKNKIDLKTNHHKEMTMKAETIREEIGDLKKFEAGEHGKPVLKENEVLIAVHAFGLKPGEASTSPFGVLAAATAGVDLAGVIEEVGERVHLFQPGDRVFGEAEKLYQGNGPFAGYAIISEDAIAPMPENMNFIEAAAVPLAAASAYEAIFEHIKLQNDQKILILGGNNAVGAYAIQLARLAGAQIATTATETALEQCQKLGAEVVINHGTTAFEEQLKDYDAVFDTIGGEAYRKAFQVVKPGGVIVSVAATPDDQLTQQTGVRTIHEKPRITRRVLSGIAQLIEDGVLTLQEHTIIGTN